MKYFLSSLLLLAFVTGTVAQTTDVKGMQQKLDELREIAVLLKDGTPEGKKATTEFKSMMKASALKVPVVRFAEMEKEGNCSRSTDNNSEVFSCPAASIVRSSAKGKVFKVVKTGDYWTVVISHGNYYTAYSGLESATVTENQEIAEKTQLGIVYAPTKKATLLFEIWDQNKKIKVPSWKVQVES